MHEGPLNLCWAAAISRYIEALLFLRRKVKVDLSAQHLVNNIRNLKKDSGDIMKYNEIRKFLIDNGLVLEETCPFTGKIKQNCAKSCENSPLPAFKIQDLIYKKQKEVNEKELIEIVNAVIEAYDSIDGYKDGIYNGQKNHKDELIGRHVVLVTGFGSTSDGVHYWNIQNSWGTTWGENGFGKILRQCSRGGNKPSLFLKVIQLLI